MDLLRDIRINSVADAAVAGTSAVNGTTIDMAGRTGVIFFCSVAVANAGNFIKVQEGDTTSPTVDIAGSAVIVATNNDIVAICIHKPLKRYLRAVLTRTSSTASGQIFAITYGGIKRPDVGANVNKILASPLAGVA